MNKNKFHKYHRCSDGIYSINIFEIILGTIIIIIWPIILSFGCVGYPNGLIGVFLGVILCMAAILISGLKNKYLFVRIARGSWIFGILCLFPFIPFIIGVMLVDSVTLFMNETKFVDEIQVKMGFISSFIVTAAYSIFSVLTSFLLGSLAYYLFNKKSDQKGDAQDQELV